MAEALKEVLEPVAKFEQNIDSYQSQAYNETQVRLEFINPFFEALGWDACAARADGSMKVINPIVVRSVTSWISALVI